MQNHVRSRSCTSHLRSAVFRRTLLRFAALGRRHSVLRVGPPTVAAIVRIPAADGHSSHKRQPKRRRKSARHLQCKLMYAKDKHRPFGGDSASLTADTAVWKWFRWFRYWSRSGAIEHAVIPSLIYRLYNRKKVLPTPNFLILFWSVIL